MSRQHKRAGQEMLAETGGVTLSGQTVAVDLESERRGLPVYAPSGYCWRPALGEKVLVLKTSEGPCVLGVIADEPQSEGEVGLRTQGGAAVTLTRDGQIRLEGNIEVEGGLSVQGEELEEIIRRIVGEMI